MMEATVTSKGQITLPKNLRDTMHLKTGDKLVFEMLKDGACLVRPKTLDVRVLKGCLSYEGAPKTLDDMERAIAENAGIHE